NDQIPSPGHDPPCRTFGPIASSRLPSRRVYLDDPPFGLGNDLRRDDDDVAVTHRRAVRDKRSEVGARLDLGQAFDGDDLESHDASLRRVYARAGERRAVPSAAAGRRPPRIAG